MRYRFNRKAPDYDQHALVQKNMAQALIILAGKSRKPVRNILEIGCGTGFLTLELIKTFPHARITAVDLAPAMVEIAMSKMPPDAQVQFFVQDAEALTLEDHFDLIISNATFQWFNQTAQTVAALAARLEPDGLLTFATFGPKTFHELHTSFKHAEQIMESGQAEKRQLVHGQQFPGKKEWQDILSLSMLSEVHISEEYHLETYASTREFLGTIKAIGANNASAKGSQLCRRRTVLLEMMKFYEQNFRSGAGVYATYHLLYGSARKAG